MPIPAKTLWLRLACLVPLLASASAQPALADAASSQPVTGPARVIDAATLEIGTRRIRLHGIDAPPRDQTCFDASESRYACGRVSAAALSDRIGSSRVTCDPRGVAPNGDILARCRVGQEDVSAWMVSNGHAIADRTVADGYVPQDERAWARRVGLWSGVFQVPAEWRRLRGRMAGL